ncbi:MAG TPA: penicillin-binding protein 2 [Patescibacteria group bacterium]|nr:penicillin-binding protein 2 [Patescibacteria group bacterium]
MKKKDGLRFGIVLVAVSLLYLALLGKLFYWQSVEAQTLRLQARAQSLETIDIPAIRGEIMTSDSFPLATNTISYTLYSNPKIIKDKSYYADKLGGALSDDPASISALLNKDLYWVKLADNLSGDQKKTIEKLNLKGVGFEQQYSRLYPEASMAAHLIGFLGKDAEGEPHGYFGIEGKYNDQLSGRPGALHAIRDALGNQILNDIREDEKIDGRDVKLTVDRSVQYLIDEKLKAGLEKYGAEEGSVIVMDSKTGAILGMSSYPGFDPAKYWEYDPSTYTNPALSSLYEPGSTFKVLIMAAAIDKHLVTPETRCDICAGPVQIGEYKIKTWNDEYIPDLTMRDTIIHSDNTGMVFVSRKLGLDNMIDYLHKFGLGEPTGIDLQGEATGIVREKNQWYPIDIATTSFGQGISVTPIQLITAVNSIANDGKLMQPYMVSQIITDTGQTIDIKPKVKAQAVSPATAKTVTSMMVDAVEEGEAKFAKIKNYRIAGKTGTAQIPVAGHYDPTQTNASFVGFFPADNPKVTMLVIVNKPKSSIYGAETAAPLFFDIARELIKYYNLPSN